MVARLGGRDLGLRWHIGNHRQARRENGETAQQTGKEAQALHSSNFGCRRRSRKSRFGHAGERRRPSPSLISKIPEIPFDIPSGASQIAVMKLDDAAARLEALGNPTRLKIYRTLVRAGEEGMAVGRLQERLDIAASTLSHHLKALIGVGLVTQTREGTTLICNASYDEMHGLIDYMVAECCVEGSCPPAIVSKFKKVA
jgi:ArsR family transcriptional regulator, arsenate/arsenite/antimonite-responsive transcriptional repressor